VEGDGQHFYATIVSPDFAGKRLVQRHQIKAFTPDEFAAQ
ncbi:MAG: hypothetical protein RL082_1572, partial [Pseudomonadota bacterium]